ncbi:MAG: phosphatase PAP2 family protein [Gemmatimonadota bacterium]
MLRLLLAALVGGSLSCAQDIEAQGFSSGAIPVESTAADSVRLLHATPGLPAARPAGVAPGAASAHVVSVMRAAPRFARITAAAVGVSALVSLADEPMMRQIARLRAPDGSMRQASVVAAALGGAVPLSLGAALWAGGAVAGNDLVQHVGIESTQAVLLSGALTVGIKGLVGRTRPNASPNDPDEYYPGRGFLDASRASFPSGHTSAAFAIATVLSRELSARYPARRWLIRTALYGAAGSVGFARMYQNAHWPSDVVTGAALGTLSGMQSLAWHRGSR